MATTARLDAIGEYLPPHRLDNHSIIDALQIDPSFLESKIGVRYRAVKSPGQMTSDLCVLAFEDLKSRTEDFELNDIDLLCVVTQNPDQNIPHTSAIVHQKLGLPKNCITFDLSQGCAGYPHGLAVVMAMVERFRLRQAVLITCDPYSVIVDETDRNTATLFGDAATASRVVGPAGPNRSEVGYRLVDSGFGTVPGSSHVLRCEDKLVMDGREVFLNAAREVPRSVQELLKSNGIDESDIDVFLFHPGSKHMIDVLRSTLGLTEQALPFEVRDYGNTVSSSLPLMLQNRLYGSCPRRIVISGYGVGFTWGSCLLERVDGEG